MRNTLMIICMPAFSTLCAQVELLSSDLPASGTVITYRSCDHNMIDTTLQGSDVTWDFSALATGVYTTTHAFMDPAATPDGSDIMGANYAKMINMGAVTQYYYYNNTNSILDLVGLWTYNSGAFNINPMRQLVFPMTFGTQHSNEVDYTTTSISGVGTGTLVIPSGTYPNVVMVRRVRVDAEVVHYNFYEWYSTETGALLLWLMSSNDGLVPYDTGVITEMSTAVNEYTGSEDLRVVYPVAEDLEVMYGKGTTGTADLVITNAIGQVLRTTAITFTPGENRSRLFVGDLANGCYLLTLRPKDSNSAVRTIRFVKQ